MDDNRFYEIEVLGRYKANFMVEGLKTAIWAVGAAKARTDVSLIRVTCGKRRAVFAYENGAWVGRGL